MRPKKLSRLPTVLTQAEVNRLLLYLNGVHLLIARMFYGTGMRLMECVRLRVKDVDFGRHEIVIRDGKGGRDRVTMQPVSVIDKLKIHLAQVRQLWEQDWQRNLPGVFRPDALDRKYPCAGKEWGWFWMFSSASTSIDPRSGVER